MMKSFVLFIAVAVVSALPLEKVVNVEIDSKNAGEGVEEKIYDSSFANANSMAMGPGGMGMGMGSAMSQNGPFGHNGMALTFSGTGGPGGNSMAMGGSMDMFGRHIAFGNANANGRRRRESVQPAYEEPVERGSERCMEEVQEKLDILTRKIDLIMDRFNIQHTTPRFSSIRGGQSTTESNFFVASLDKLVRENALSSDTFLFPPGGFPFFRPPIFYPFPDTATPTHPHVPTTTSEPEVVTAIPAITVKI